MATDIAEFDRLMRSYYCKKSERLDRQLGALWVITTDLVRAVHETALDGSGTTALKEFNQTCTENLRALIEREGG